MRRGTYAGGFVALALLLTACRGGGGGSAGEPTTQVATLEDHVLARTAYGPDAWTRERIAAIGVDAYLEEQLHPDSIPDDALEARLAAYPSLDLDFLDLSAAYGDKLNVPLREVAHARLLRAVLSHRQLEQMLVDFWFNHFNVFGLKGYVLFAVAPYERRSIRPFVFGRFEDMLISVAKSAAMLHYLDNVLSTRPGFVSGGMSHGLNENFARELLELHTVGADGGYSQQDVIDVARAFTGWSLSAPPVTRADGFYFWAAAHDSGEKHVMQLAIPAGGGIEDGLDVIAFLAAQPSTAYSVCGQLVDRFVSEQPLPSLVQECADVFLSSGGDLRAVTRAILYSREFRDPVQRGGKLKRPLVFVASLLRTTGAQVDDAMLDRLFNDLIRLGEAPYLARPPTGYPDVSSHWSGAGGLLDRFDLISRISDADAELGIDWDVRAGSSGEIVDALASRLLRASLSHATRDAVVARLDALAAAPDSARVREAAALLLASPEFMRH